ncbi:MAG TPA: winged helix-turn-helix domain-containing protein [Thermoanaerobaculia bacterium]
MIHRFESFELDTDRYELRREGRPRPIEPQVFALLTLLVENRHRMVPRDEIIQAVWTGRAVSDSALSSRVKSARHALDDDGNAQRLIRTVHGQGFRFVGEAESVAAPEAAKAPAASPTAAQEWTHEVLARPVLAVLPFENEGGRAEDAYVAEGIAEDLIAELSSWRWFPIVSRDSSFDRSRAALPASARAAAVGARYAVTGRLLRSGDSSRLTVELLDTASDTQLWSTHYRVGTAELAGLQSKIAAEIFRRIAPELTSEETRRIMRKRHEDLTAWDMTIKGLWHLHRATQHDFGQALALLEDATRVDPGFAMPWSFIALARFEQALKGWTASGGAPGGVRDLFREMLEAASTSVELDPSSWLGHALMSAGELWTNLSFPRARLHANRALELNPSASMAHHFSGCISGFAGDLKGAIATQGNVYRVDPQYGHADVVEADLGLWHLLAGRHDRAAEHLRSAIGLNPANLRARQRQVVLGGLSGDATLVREAFAAIESLGGSMDEQYLAASYPFQDPRHAETFRKGLEAAERLR